MLHDKIDSDLNKEISLLAMMSRSGASTTMTVMEEAPAVEEAKIITIYLRPSNRVQWAEGTIDNEHMNKRKSKSKSKTETREGISDVYSPTCCFRSDLVCCKFERTRTHPDDTSSSESCDSDDDAACNNYDRYPRHQRKAMRAKKE